MTTQSPDPKEDSLRPEEELNLLAAEHHELDDRLHHLNAKQYLSPPERVEEVTLKKRKLALKDRMEHIKRRNRGAMRA